VAEEEMMANDNPTALAAYQAPTLAEMSQDFAALVALKGIMRNGTDYGTIPGCGDKPALFKPGAEKVLKRFMCHVTDIDVEDLSTPDCIRYRLRCYGTTPDGIRRGVGIGECSTDEEKYRWRKAQGAEFDDTVDDRKRLKYYKNYTAKQVRTNPADLANTVLKMAKKRAMVDLALTATAASDFFTQDVEDMPAELQQQVEHERRARPSDPFAPPIEVEAEVVPPESTPYSELVAICKLNGHSKDDLVTALKDTGHNGRAVDELTVVQCDEILDSIERAKGA
jgi:hypothetical protein